MLREVRQQVRLLRGCVRHRERLLPLGPAVPAARVRRHPPLGPEAHAHLRGPRAPALWPRARSTGRVALGPGLLRRVRGRGLLPGALRPRQRLLPLRGRGGPAGVLGHRRVGGEESLHLRGAGEPRLRHREGAGGARGGALGRRVHVRVQQQRLLPGLLRPRQRLLPLRRGLGPARVPGHPAVGLQGPLHLRRPRERGVRARPQAPRGPGGALGGGLLDTLRREGRRLPAVLRQGQRLLPLRQHPGPGRVPGHLGLGLQGAAHLCAANGAVLVC
mmetsp:Transcript_111541/g.311804  ORF Transcript_111541/g.311804 Transcript_111541/m.311804 type:complete len:274 (-) Transcript_111541:1001-1822(-)